MEQNENGTPIEHSMYPQAPGQIGTALIDDNPQAQDYKAAAAIEGMPGSATTDKLKLMEKQYQLWLSEGAIDVPLDCEGFPGPYESRKVPISRMAALFGMLRGYVEAEMRAFAGVKLTRTQIIEIAGDPLRIFRMEIKELALAYAAELNNKRALEQQADQGREYIRIQAKQSEFVKFLQQHFEEELDAGRARKLDLFEIAQGIMLGLKK